MEKQNYSIRLDLKKLKEAFVYNFKGKTATRKCIVIPVDNNPAIYVGEKCAYLNLNAFEVTNPQYDDTHAISESLPKEVREAMSEEERRNMPIVGNMRPFKSQQMQASGTVTVGDGDDCPF